MRTKDPLFHHRVSKALPAKARLNNHNFNRIAAKRSVFHCLVNAQAEPMV